MILFREEKASIIFGSNFSSLRWSDLAGFVIKSKQKIQLSLKELFHSDWFYHKQTMIFVFLQISKSWKNRSPILPDQLVEKRKNYITCFLWPHEKNHGHFCGTQKKNSLRDWGFASMIFTSNIQSWYVKPFSLTVDTPTQGWKIKFNIEYANDYT